LSNKNQPDPFFNRILGRGLLVSWFSPFKSALAWDESGVIQIQPAQPGNNVELNQKNRLFEPLLL
jgi:hypothetical protein